MFFIDEAHKRNYETLLENFNDSLPSIEYEVAAYIMAVPEILKRLPVDSLRYPFEWVYVWEDENDPETKRLSDAVYYMDDPYRELVLAGFHMFNGEPFRLNRGLDHWQDIHFKLFVQACKIRGRFE